MVSEESRLVSFFRSPSPYSSIFSSAFLSSLSFCTSFSKPMLFSHLLDLRESKPSRKWKGEGRDDAKGERTFAAICCIEISVISLISNKTAERAKTLTRQAFRFHARTKKRGRDKTSSPTRLVSSSLSPSLSPTSSKGILLHLIRSTYPPISSPPRCSLLPSR